MKPVHLAWGVALTWAGALACALAFAFAGAPAAAAAPPCAVVELFTSEGCSSCPPAEALLTQLDASARAKGQRVFLLEFHVDYWDAQGWRDPWSSAAATDRQRAYAQRLGLEQVYTPQMIVNGRAEFVGSNGARAGREIDAALARPAAVGVEVAADARDPATVRVRVTPPPRDAVVLVARVDDPPASHVARGENAGRVLRHTDVVRAFASAAPGPDGRATIALGKCAGGAGGAATAGRLVAIVQDRATGAVLGAGATAR